LPNMMCSAYYPDKIQSNLDRHIDMFVFGRMYSAPQLAEVALYNILTHEEAMREKFAGMETENDENVEGGGQSSSCMNEDISIGNSLEINLDKMNSNVRGATDSGASVSDGGKMQPMEELKMLLKVARLRFTGRSPEDPVRIRLVNDNSYFDEWAIDPRSYPCNDKYNILDEDWESQSLRVEQNDTFASSELFDELRGIFFPRSVKCADKMERGTICDDGDNNDGDDDDDGNDEDDDRFDGVRFRRALLADRRGVTRATIEAEQRQEDINSRANSGDRNANIMRSLNLTVPLYSMEGANAYVPRGLEEEEEEEEEEEDDVEEEEEEEKKRMRW